MMIPIRIGRVVASITVPLLLILATSRVAHASKCHEVSDTVGETKCTEYGYGWAIEKQLPLTFRFGFRYGELSTGDRTFREVVGKGRGKDYVGYRFPGGALGVPQLTAGGTDGGIAFYVWHQLYVGLEGGLMFGAMNSRNIAVPSKQIILYDDTGSDITMMHYGIPIGYRIPLGRASIRTEMFFGHIEATVSHRGVNEKSEKLYRVEETSRFLIEPRIAADIWFTQHISFGAYAGVNLLDSRGRALGLSLTWHHRAFDGDMSLW
jgi:hypothetical protein